MLNFLITFLQALPELVRLVKDIDNHLKQVESEEQAKERVAKIRQAFKDKNAEALTSVFTDDPNK